MTTTRKKHDLPIMDFYKGSINNCYILQEALGENEIFSTWRAKAVYSPNTFSISFFNFLENPPPGNTVEKFESLFFRIYHFNNPYIHSPFEYNEFENQKYIASNWISGFSLSQVIEKKLIIDFDQMMNIVIFILKGLSSLEKLGVHHNCLSPRAVVVPDENVEYGMIKIRNVGISLLADAFPEGEYFKKNQPYYLRPDKYPDGPHRDIYAIGIIMERLLSCLKEKDRPEDEFPELQKLMKKFKTKPDHFSSIDEVLDGITSIHPEKKMIDHLNEHAAAQSKGKTFSDIFGNIIKKDGELPSDDEQDLPELVEYISPVADYNRHSPAPPDADSPGEEIPVSEKNATRSSFYKRIVSALKRAFRPRKTGGRQKKVAEKKDSDGKPVKNTPGKSRETEKTSAKNNRAKRLPESESGIKPEDNYNIDGNLNDRAVEDEERKKRRIIELFRRLQEHFSGSGKPPAAPSYTFSRTTPGKKQTLPPDGPRHRKGRQKETLGHAPTNPDGDGNAVTGTRGRPKKNRNKLGGTGQPGSAGSPLLQQKEPGKGESYIFGEGPGYGPGELRSLEDEEGAQADSVHAGGRIISDRVSPDATKDGSVNGNIQFSEEEGPKRTRNLEKLVTEEPDESKLKKRKASDKNRKKKTERISKEKQAENKQKSDKHSNKKNRKTLPQKKGKQPFPSGKTYDSENQQIEKKRKGFFMRIRIFIKRIIRGISGLFKKRPS